METFAHDFQRDHPEGRFDLVSLETVEGADQAKLYDITRYPAVLALNDNGELLKAWMDESLPLMNEVAYYATQ